MMRSLSVGLLAFAAMAANAQFNGPAPLAWRWLPPSGTMANGSPLVSGDSIYEACGGRVYAVDLSTGNKKWQFPPQEPIAGKFRTPPIMVNGMLVATGDNNIVYAIDPATGSQKWSFVLPGSPMGQPIGVDKTIIQAQSDNKLIAIDSTTGTTFWKNPDSGDLAPYTITDGIYGQIAASGTSILYFTNKNQLHTLDVASRLESGWARPVQFAQLSVGATPLVFNDMIYVTSGQFLAAISPGTGEPTWQTSTGFNTAFAPTASAQGVFVVSTDGNAMLYDLTTGQPTTGMPTPVSLGSYPVAAPTAVGDKFVVPTTSGALDLVDPSNGAILWSYVIRPMGKLYAQSSSSQNGGLGGGGGFGGGGGGFAGGQGPGKGGGAGGANQNKGEEITEIQASGPAVLMGQTLLLPAKDNSLLAFDKNLGVDLTAPKTQMLFPLPGDQVAGLPPLLLYFMIRDEGSGVNEKSIKVSIDDKPYEFKYKRDGSVTINFSTTGKNRPLADGRHVITIESSDWLGNTAKEHYSLTIDNSLPPVKLPGTDTTNTPGGRLGGGGGPGGGPGLGGAGGGGGGGGGD